MQAKYSRLTFADLVLVLLPSNSWLELSPFSHGNERYSVEKKMNNAVCENKNLSKLALGCGNISKIVNMHYSFKGRGPGINSSQSKKCWENSTFYIASTFVYYFFENIWFQWF